MGGMVIAANAGTPLVIAGAMHLYVGNLIIGVVEGLILARVWKLHTGKAVSLLIAANYLSMFAGSWSCSWISYALTSPRWNTPPIERATMVLVVGAVFFFLITILLEWPIIALATKKGERSALGSLKQSVLLQTISYAVLVPFYLLLSPITFVTKASYMTADAMPAPMHGWVWYLDSDKGDIWRVRLDGSVRKQSMRGDWEGYGDRLQPMESGESSNWDLHIISWKPESEHPSRELAIAAFSETSTSPGNGRWSGSRGDANYVFDTWQAFGKAGSFIPENDVEWDAYCGDWADQGIRIDGPERQSYSLAFATPFMGWHCRNATLLPNNQVVFQLGDQIILLDMPTKRFTCLAIGRGPVVSLDEPVLAGS